MITFLKVRKAWILGALILLGVTGLFLASIPRGNELPDFLENPGQGYDLYLAAANEMAGQPGSLTNGFANFVAMNKRAYDALDRAVKENFETPSRIYEPNGVMANLSLLKRTGQALLARSRAAEEEGKTAEAMDRCLETILFGQKVEHGPLISFLVGLAIENMAMNRLEQLIPSISETNLATVIPMLIKANQSRLPHSEVVRRERYFISRNATNMVQALQATLSPQSRKTIKSVEEKGLKTTARMEALATAMALRQFELNRKASSNTEQTLNLNSVKQLMPRFLNEIPIDPFSKKELRLNQNGEKSLIFSVGPNRKDESGQGDDIAVRIW